MLHAPNLANTLAGVPLASRINTGRSGLCCLIVGYFDTTNCLPIKDTINRAMSIGFSKGSWKLTGYPPTPAQSVSTKYEFLEWLVKMPLKTTWQGEDQVVDWRSGGGLITSAVTTIFVSTELRVLKANLVHRLAFLYISTTSTGSDSVPAGLRRWTMSNGNRMTGQIAGKTGFPLSPRFYQEERARPLIYSCFSEIHLHSMQL